MEDILFNQVRKNPPIIFGAHLKFKKKNDSMYSKLPRTPVFLIIKPSQGQLWYRTSNDALWVSAEENTQWFYSPLAAIFYMMFTSWICFLGPCNKNTIKQQKFVLSQCRRPEVWNQGVTGPCSLGKSPPTSLSFWWHQAFLGLWTYHSSVPASSHGFSSVS